LDGTVERRIMPSRPPERDQHSEWAKESLVKGHPRRAKFVATHKYGVFGAHAGNYSVYVAGFSAN
jgi:hypothetical protein